MIGLIATFGGLIVRIDLKFEAALMERMQVFL